MRILLVDDDEILTQTLVPILTAQHYAVDVAVDGEDGWDYAQAATYDLIVLDVNLPKFDGIRLCHRLRQSGYDKPILLLTAKGTSSDKVVGLDAGADDYVVKPCTPEELGARIRALLRRKNPSVSPILTWGNLRFDPSLCEVTYNGKPLTLSPKEYGLLELFLRNPQRIFNSSLILEHLWSFEDIPSEETVRSHIKRLRQKLKAVGIEDMIENIYGMGYRLKTAVSQPTAADQARTAAVAAWDRLKTPILERVTVIEQAIAALQTTTLSTDLHQQAEHAAHKLAGSLGMFGFADGSQIARKIEDWFHGNPTPSDFADLELMVARLRRELAKPPYSNDEDWLSLFNAEDTQPPARDIPLVLIVEDDAHLAQELNLEATKRQMRTVISANPARAIALIEEELPDVVLMDLTFPNTPYKGLDLLQDVSTRFPRLPILVFTANDTFSDRLEVARRYGHGFISKSCPVGNVLDIVQSKIRTRQPTVVTVLAVDDDPLVAEILQRFLQPWGIELKTLHDPRHFWETLNNIRPDLLILDIEMPHINGIELCQVVRNDPQWESLPILFLSSRRDAESIYQIYRAGADDYIAKPFTEPELVTRIFNRLERHYLLRHLVTTEKVAQPH